MYQPQYTFNSPLDDELRRIEQAFIGPGDVFWLTPLGYEKIVKPREGMLMYADGDNYDPGEGKGHYSFNGTDWKRLLTGVAGTYTPTLANTTNVTGSTAYVCMYFRVGDIVHVSGQVNIQNTATGNTVLRMTLPILSAISNDYELAGTANSGTPAECGAAIYGDAANDGAEFRFQAPDITNRAFYFTFTYRVL